MTFNTRIQRHRLRPLLLHRIRFWHAYVGPVAEYIEDTDQPRTQPPIRRCDQLGASDHQD